MTLGERIQQLRKAQGLSQEGLGEAIGVSRQAVSKWETGQSLPDTANLLAMAELFGVSADELAAIKAQSPLIHPEETFKEAEKAQPLTEPVSSSRSPRLLLLCGLLAVAVVVIAAAAGGVFSAPAESPPASGSTSAEEDPDALSDLSLCFDGEDGPEHLSLGSNEEGFPFGTSLTQTAREWTYSGDWGVEFHDATCGPIYMTYYETDDPDSAPYSIYTLRTIVGGFATPRGISVGSPRADLMAAYGDDLVYCMKESGSDVFVRHDCYYTYLTDDGGVLFFYMQDGHVAGLQMKLLLDEDRERYLPDNLSRFPVVDGEPDFSHREEPEQEEIDANRAVYIAFHALTTDANLSAEEQYQYRRTIFENLQNLDWTTYGAQGEAGRDVETCGELTAYLASMGDLTESEILNLQLGVRSKPDGFYTENYSAVLANAFFLYPIQFTQCLANNGLSLQEAKDVVSFTAYGADYFTELKEAAVGQVERYGLTGQEGAWADYLVAYMRAPLGTGNEIPLPEGVYGTS